MFAQIHDLVYHGGGGFLHSEVYNMPVWMRSFHINRINDFKKKENEEHKKAQGQSNIGDDKVHSPNINPSSTYNF
tara:strand:+ start:80 stop:304 length:225 start_codon:yes stop_codon:yes gene_type:complete